MAGESAESGEGVKGMVKLIPGETWFPQANKVVAPRQIVASIVGLIRYKTTVAGRVLPRIRVITEASMRAWIKKWDCKL